MAGGDNYEAVLVLDGDGSPLPQDLVSQLQSLGGYFDPALNGVVFATSGFPASIVNVMKQRRLKAGRVELDYDPDWHRPPGPDPVWEKLPALWDGHPPVIAGMLPLRWLWVCCPSLNDGHPFDILWLGDGNWTTQDGNKYTPQNVLDQNWTLLATSGEVLDMSHKRMDDANARRLNRTHKDAIAQDFAGSALQVAMITGRISLHPV